MKNKIAIFDIDGTIFRKNLSFELINELSWMKIFKKEIRNELVRLYSSWLDHEGTYEEYRKSLVKLYEENLKGHTPAEIKSASRIVVSFFKNRTYIFAEKLIKELRRKGYQIIAISGSPIEIVKEYNKYLKFDSVYGSVYAVDARGFYTGEISFDPVIRKGAVAKQYIMEEGLTLKGSYGIGDTESDADFLNIVDNPIAFNPNLNLKNIAEKKKWRIVVEKKDLIYDFSQSTKLLIKNI